VLIRHYLSFEQGFIKKGDDIADYHKKICKWSHKYQRIERHGLLSGFGWENMIDKDWVTVSFKLRCVLM